ncbi:MAG: RNA-binding protein [Rhodobacterales bacterium 32-67-9]|nr:MAG: RNA-binding protein [Rhodobacterales bacterium 32-67-9]
MAEDRIRIDKWLWQARFFKTRSLAAGVVSAGHLRINGDRTEKPGRAVGPGDVLTFRQGSRVRVVRVLGCGTRRGPATEARTLYDDLDPPPGDTVLPDAGVED